MSDGERGAGGRQGRRPSTGGGPRRPGGRGRGPSGRGGRGPGRAGIARVAALDALGRVDGGLGSPEALSQALSDRRVGDPRDRGLATELVYGVLRWRRRLDHLLAPYVTARGGIGGLEPAARDVLRLGAHQIVALDRVPGPVAVSATQDAARAVGLGRLAGLANGVLRKLVAEEGHGLSRLPAGLDDGAIGVRASLPDWVVAALRDTFGADGVEAEAMALRDRATNTVRPTRAWGRVRDLRASLAEEGFEAVDADHGTLVIRGPGDPFATRAFRAGAFVPQDPASLAVVDALGALDGKRVLDLCAGRGIKTTAMLDRGAAQVVAVDVARRKLDEAEALTRRLGLPADRLVTRAGDPTAPGGLVDLGLADERFDVVLVDAPCTGLGTLRQHPEIAWRRRPQDVAALTALQSKLVAAGAQLLAPGGELTYAVCSFIRAEGDPSVPSAGQASSMSGEAGRAPSQLEPLEPAGVRRRPTSGWDAFQHRRWRRVDP